MIEKNKSKRKISKHVQSLREKTSFKTRILIISTAFVLVGVIILAVSKAAVPVISIQPENGTKSPNIASVQDGTASNGSAVKFSKGMVMPPSASGSFLFNPTLGARFNQYTNDSEAVVTQNLTSRGNLESNPSGVNNANGQGQFRVFCQYSHLNYDDPIVFPGQPGAAHLHMYWGNTKADASTTTSSLLNSGGSSCEGYEANRTAYWMPALLDANNKVVIPKDILMYYKSAANLNAQTKPMPQGLKMIAGNSTGNSLSTPNNVNGIQWECYTGSLDYSYQGQTIPNSCPPKPQNTDGFPLNLVAIIYFPSCVKVNNDGSPVLDSPDHKSHLAYFISSAGKLACPSTHPYIMPQLSYHISWPGDGNYTGWHLSSDRMNTTLPNGSSLHADWYNGWNKSIIDHWTGTCINLGQNCSAGVMGPGNGYSLQQLARIPTSYTGPNPLTVPQ